MRARSMFGVRELSAEGVFLGAFLVWLHQFGLLPNDYHFALFCLAVCFMSHQFGDIKYLAQTYAYNAVYLACLSIEPEHLPIMDIKSVNHILRDANHVTHGRVVS